MLASNSRFETSQALQRLPNRLVQASNLLQDGSDMDNDTKFEIKRGLDRVNEILQTGVIQNQRERNPLSQSAFIELMIVMNDLVGKCKRYAEPVTFVDDINVTETIKNVADAINFVRNALCHINSPNHNHALANARISRNTVFGKAKLGMINGVLFESSYDDDICFFFGDQKLYLFRHIVRAHEEARSKLVPLINMGSST